MKKIIFAFLCLTIFTLSSFAQQNDIIISKTESTIRYKHEQDFSYGFDKEYAVYENPSVQQEIFKLPYGTGVQILEIEVQNSSAKESVWYKIEYKNQTGWIKTDFNPYKNGNWEILGTETVDGNSFTIRKANKKLILEPPKETLNLYEKPSFNAEISVSTKNETVVNVIAVTEETETIKWGTYTKSEHWVKVLFEEKEVWVFGAYLDTGMGGPKYPIPENIIRWNLEAGGV